VRKDYEFLKGDEVPAFDNIGVLKEFLSITFFSAVFCFDKHFISLCL